MCTINRLQCTRPQDCLARAKSLSGANALVTNSRLLKNKRSTRPPSSLPNVNYAPTPRICWCPSTRLASAPQSQFGAKVWKVSQDIDGDIVRELEVSLAGRMPGLGHRLWQQERADGNQSVFPGFEDLPSPVRAEGLNSAEVDRCSFIIHIPGYIIYYSETDTLAGGGRVVNWPPTCLLLSLMLPVCAVVTKSNTNLLVQSSGWQDLQLSRKAARPC